MIDPKIETTLQQSTHAITQNKQEIVTNQTRQKQVKITHNTKIIANDKTKNKYQSIIEYIGYNME